MADVADVEDPDPAQPLRAHRVLQPLGPTVQPGREVLTGDKEQVLVGGYVTLGGGTDICRLEAGPPRVADIPHLPSVIVALNDVVAIEGHVRVGDIHELL